MFQVDNFQYFQSANIKLIFAHQTEINCIADDMAHWFRLSFTDLTGL